MARRIKMYDMNYFIVVISQYSWEEQFSKELGEVLGGCGAFNILEFANHFAPRFGNGTTYLGLFEKDNWPRHNKYHPYAFVGIPGLSPGLGFEKLRSNQGFYLTTANQPYAELKVRLRWNTLTQMYAFD